MRQLRMPEYQPLFPAPERAVLTLLHAALHVTEHAMRDAHPLVGTALGEPQREPGDDLILCAVKLIIGRCAELRELADLYDTLVDRLRAESDEDITF